MSKPGKKCYPAPVLQGLPDQCRALSAVSQPLPEKPSPAACGVGKKRCHFHSSPGGSLQAGPSECEGGAVGWRSLLETHGREFATLITDFLQANGIEGHVKAVDGRAISFGL
jgi:hypothetical protein